MQTVLSALSEGDSQFSAPGVPQLPQDLGTRRNARTESYGIQAIVAIDRDAEQPSSDSQTALSARMDRVAITPPVETLKTDSAWRYSGIMRSTVFVDAPSTGTEKTVLQVGDNVSATQLATMGQRQSIQRMALDLAGVTADSLWVENDRMSILMAEGDGNDCRREYRWDLTLSESQRATLNVAMEKCPAIRRFGAFNGWQQASAELTGSFITRHKGGNEHTTKVTGFAWITQSWGNFPPGDGAVVIDSLQMRLDDSRWLNVSRSTRRSGRGPKTVVASISVKGAEPEEIAMTWEDSREEGFADSGSAYPLGIQLTSQSHDLALSIKVMNGLNESSDFGEFRLDVPVTVTGTQSGAGFLSFIAMARINGKINDR